MCCLQSTVTKAADISISAEISRSTMAFEEKDTLTVNLIWEGEPFLFQVDSFPMPALEKFEILGSSSSVSTAADTRGPGVEVTTRTFRYILQPIDFGTGIINPLNLTAKNRVTGESHDLKTGRLMVEIAKPIPRPKAESGKTTVISIVLAAAFVAAGAAAAVVLFRKRRRKPEPQEDRSYLDSLADIKKETVADRKLFYSRVYRLLLSYLEKERGLDVSGKTGEEVIEIVGGLEDDSEKAGMVRWLNEAQKVKYQPNTPSPGDVENSYNALCVFFENKAKKK